MRRPPILAVVGAILLAACGQAIPARCELDDARPRPDLTCDVAIAAARDRLEGTGGVRSLEILYGGFCPVGGQCGDVHDGNTARIVVRMVAEPELAMVVHLQPDGSTQVLGPERIPAPTTLD